MVQSELKDMLDMFKEGDGYGDPEERRNAELRLQIMLAEQQRRIAARLHALTFLTVFVSFLQVVVLVLQAWGK